MVIRYKNNLIIIIIFFFVFPISVLFYYNFYWNSLDKIIHLIQLNSRKKFCVSIFHTIYKL